MSGGIVSGIGMIEGAEEDLNTELVDNVNLNLNAKRQGIFITLPSTAKFWRITHIEWENGDNVAGDLQAGVDIVDADPPVAVNSLNVALAREVAQGATGQQSVTLISSYMIPAGTVIYCWLSGNDVATSQIRGKNSEPNINQQKTVAYTLNPPRQDETAWTTGTSHVKLLVKGIGFS